MTLDRISGRDFKNSPERNTELNPASDKDSFNHPWQATAGDACALESTRLKIHVPVPVWEHALIPEEEQDHPMGGGGRPLPHWQYLSPHLQYHPTTQPGVSVHGSHT